MERDGEAVEAPDIFISYAREDSATAKRLVAALEKRGWSVFIDGKTPIGPRFDRHIAEQLQAASCVIVLWSEESILSEWVSEEAAHAKTRDVLAPVRLQDVDPPFGFAHRNYADLFGWRDGRPHDGFDQLLSRITALAGSPATIPEIPRAYWEWLRRRCASVELLGQETKKGHAVTPEQVCVPAVTQPAPAATAPRRRDETDPAEESLSHGYEPRTFLLERLAETSLFAAAPAGAGKSTSCRWAALQCPPEALAAHPVAPPEGWAEPSPASLRARLPLVVPLREFARCMACGRGRRTSSRSELERALAGWIDGDPPDGLSGAVLRAHLLLTAVCVLYDNGGRLPEDRYELYRSIVSVVLHSRYPGDARLREPVLRRLEAIAYGMHTGEPAGPRRKTPAAEIGAIETERLIAHFANLNPAYEQGQVESAVQREDLLHRSGLLVPRAGDRSAFYHLSFQEFLAAQRIARAGDRLEQLFRTRSAVGEWHSTLLFLFARR